MTVYYVDAAVGNDANDGLAEGSSNAWASIREAANSVVSGDYVYVKASAPYTGLYASFSTRGNVANEIIVEGYSSTPGDNGKVTVDATGQSFGIYSSQTGQMWYLFKNFIIENATSVGFNWGSADNFTLYNCIFRNNGNSGITGDNSVALVNCEVYGNAFRGIDIDASLMLIGCKVYNNATDQVYCDTIYAIHNNIIYGASEGYYLLYQGTNANYVASHNVFDATGVPSANGIHFQGGIIGVNMHNIFSNVNVASVIISSSQVIGGGFFYGYNCMANVDVAYANAAAGFIATDRPWVGTGDVTTSNAGFVDISTGDARLLSGSPALGAGITVGSL